MLTGFLICGHLWGNQPDTRVDAWHRWTLRADLLIPPGMELATFSASRVFAAVYPEAVQIAALTASPSWRGLAAGDSSQQREFQTEIGLRLGHPDYRPPAGGDAIAHWMTFDSWRGPSRPERTFRDTRAHHSTRPYATSAQSRDRQDRSATWFAVNRRGGAVILHHRHIRPVLAREWAPRMDGIEAMIWASQASFVVAGGTDATCATAPPPAVPRAHDGKHRRRDGRTHGRASDCAEHAAAPAWSRESPTSTATAVRGRPESTR